ncbi:hypothetical protein TWF281_006334 [Arthrobotrys megalospora]
MASAPFVFTSGAIPAYGSLSTPVAAHSNATSNPVSDGDSPSDSSDCESIFSTTSNDTDVTAEMYTVDMVLWYPRIPYVRPRCTVYTIGMPVPFLDEHVIDIFDPIIGRFFEEELQKDGDLCVDYQEHGAGNQIVQYFPHPWVRMTQARNIRVIETLAMNHGLVRFAAVLKFPWYCQPANIAKGIASFITLSLLNDCILCFMLCLIGRGPRMLIMEAIIDMPLFALIIGALCHLMIRALHGKHRMGWQDQFVWGGSFCFCWA